MKTLWNITRNLAFAFVVLCFIAYMCSSPNGSRSSGSSSGGYSGGYGSGGVKWGLTSEKRRDIFNEAVSVTAGTNYAASKTDFERPKGMSDAEFEEYKKLIRLHVLNERLEEVAQKHGITMEVLENIRKEFSE